MTGERLKHKALSMSHEIMRNASAIGIERVRVGFDGWTLQITSGPKLEKTTAEEIPLGYPLVAPLTGVFYRASSPNAKPYVEVGDQVEAGQVVGTIETMKIFNEVLAERRGRIATIIADNGKLVEQGDELMRIGDSDGSDNPELLPYPINKK